MEDDRRWIEPVPVSGKCTGDGLSAAHDIRIAVERPDAVAGLVLIGPTGYERLARPQGPTESARSTPSRIHWETFCSMSWSTNAGSER
jgi:pimeloyl-ACP methyl ester carboxylesterase